MDRSFVRLDPTLMMQLRQIRRLTGITIQSLLDKAVAQYLKNDIPPILESWGVTAREIDEISQMRYDKEPKNQLPAPKKALA